MPLFVSLKTALEKKTGCDKPETSEQSWPLLEDYEKRKEVKKSLT